MCCCVCFHARSIVYSALLSHEQKMDLLVYFMGLRELDAWTTHGLGEEWVQVVLIILSMTGTWTRRGLDVDSTWTG